MPKGEVHDPADHHQAEFPSSCMTARDVPVALAADDQCDAEEQRHDYHGQDVALCQCLERILEEPVCKLCEIVGQRHLSGPEAGGRLGKHRKLHALAGTEEVGGTEADDDGNGHRQDEEAQGQLPDAMHLVVRLQVGDADDDRRKDERQQYHAQQVEEDRSGSLHHRAPVPRTTRPGRHRERPGRWQCRRRHRSGLALRDRGKIMRSGSTARRWGGGSGEIRTHEGLPLPVSATGAIDHSATLPKGADDNTSQMVTRLHVIALQLSSPFSSLTAVSTLNLWRMTHMQEQYQWVPPRLPSSRLNRVALQQNRVLRNTYLMLALTMVPTVIGALIGVQLNFSFFAGSPLISFCSSSALPSASSGASRRPRTARWALCSCSASRSSWG